MPDAVLPPGFATTRTALQRVAVHVLARRRHHLVGRLGLRATPGGFGTPDAGPDHHHEVLRVAGTWLLRERVDDTAATEGLDLTTASLAAAAALAGVDLDAEFSAGHDTPEVGDPAMPLAVDPASAAVLADWYAFGWRVLDAAVAVAAAGDPAATPSIVQLWPEHFDAGCDLAVGAGRVNVGVSPGDGFHEEPYLYVGPWGTERPGDAAYWNAPFGAVLGWSALQKSKAPPAGAFDFVHAGLVHLASDRTG